MQTKLETFLDQLVEEKRTGEIKPLEWTPNQRRILKAIIQKMRAHGLTFTEETCKPYDSQKK